MFIGSEMREGDDVSLPYYVFSIEKEILLVTGAGFFIHRVTGCCIHEQFRAD
jgi:hypothetical protein